MPNLNISEIISQFCDKEFLLFKELASIHMKEA